MTGSSSRGAVRPGLVVSSALMLLVACSVTTRTRVLSKFFDGVPPAGSRVVEPSGPASKAAPVKNPDQAKSTAVAPPAAPVVPPAPIEAYRSWHEVLAALPVRSDGGVDWSRAYVDGLVTPRLLGRSPAPTTPPHSLDSLMDLASGDPRLPAFNLDLRITPHALADAEAASLYEVRFPHSSHTAWLGCTSCHPGVTTNRTDMRGILDGQHCGRCHGRVSFAPEVSCSRCHTRLEPLTKVALDAEISAASHELAEPQSQILDRGAATYKKLCSICHGDAGDGKGSLSPSLVTKPRDFTAGKYKFRSTLPQSIPSDLDIFTTITRGVPGTSMPAFAALPREDRWALTHYVKSFSKKFVESTPQPIPSDAAPAVTPELLELGKTLYVEAGCNLCHGDNGRGDGPSAATLKDDWGNSLRPFNFTSGRPLKSGTGVEAIYRALMTGLQGTPMPGFGDSLEPQQGWALASYVMTFFGREPQPFAVKGDITFVRNEAAMATPDSQHYPPVVFPHWIHRTRAKCQSCHPSPFEMRAGANPVSMDRLRAGQYCAQCHNGKVAWEVGFKTCVKCHVNPGQ
jgi:cytochrome c oxidase cbb3-type subunit 2